VIEFRTRPKGDYIQRATWQDLYILTEKWNNTMEFQLLEIEFMQRLIEAYFVKLLLQENLDDLRELQNSLDHFANQAQLVLQRIQLQLKQIIDLLDAPSMYAENHDRGEYTILENDISEFTTVQKALKLTVFNVTKTILESEKPKFIWKYN
jgi:hypothetical protein